MTKKNLKTPSLRQIMICGNLLDQINKEEIINFLPSTFSEEKKELIVQSILETKKEYYQDTEVRVFLVGEICIPTLEEIFSVYFIIFDKQRNKWKCDHLIEFD